MRRLRLLVALARTQRLLPIQNPPIKPPGDSEQPQSDGHCPTHRTTKLLKTRRGYWCRQCNDMIPREKRIP
jgi:hypothetical protein